MIVSRSVSHRTLFYMYTLLCLFCNQRAEAFVPPKPKPYLTAYSKTTLLHALPLPTLPIVSSIASSPPPLPSLIVSTAPFSLDDLVAAPPSLVGGITQGVRNLVTFGVGSVAAFMVFGIVGIFGIAAFISYMVELEAEEIIEVEDYVQKHHPDVWREFQDEFAVYDGEDNPLERRPELAEEWLSNRLERTLRFDNAAIEALLKDKYSDVWEEVRGMAEKAKKPMQRARFLDWVLETESIPRPTTKKEQDLTTTTSKKDN